MNHPVEIPRSPWRPVTGLVVLLAGFLVLGCGSSPRGGKAAHQEPAEAPASGEPAEAHSDEEENEQVVQLSREELTEFGIEVRKAGPARIEVFQRLPGEVRPNADRLAHIVPRFDGIVSEVKAQVGDVVEPGQVLAIIEGSESLSNYELKTLLGGTVIAKHLTPGEAVSRGAESFVIADLGTVWVELTVYQRDLKSVRTGQRALVATGHDAGEAPGTISYVTPVVDEATRTATARVVLPNPGQRWRPGTFVTARVLVGSSQAEVAVPATALHTVDGQTVVFVETDDGFRPRPVKTGRAGETFVEITSGLAAGERYVSQGGFTIKAALAKESFGGGHAH
jgi:cobalt-zinc-cadmium efflux system membrane fusion protein